MIGIIMIIAIARWFSKLAFDYDKNRWLYGFLGVVTYYGGFFALSLLFTFVDDESLHPVVMVIVTVGLSYGMVAVLYYSLRRVWKKNYVIGNNFPEGEAELLDTFRNSNSKEF